ncbi:LexA family transcriptional regulator [Endozoicomonas sp. SCSIO W0465]|uniref:LexA family transcriptional regulator n=1 Tax=Endozoicomonas sp. SCSIO W0465 TaxID=2918516 RepID=UPI002074D012|nr:LexA family transcriptional regulator [Endozoicomonas sp. SCSIO W0465]USE36916.1 LexA family transcriptional regulator [Endozoicomonas sp. SCSIO W0465]
MNWLDRVKDKMVELNLKDADVVRQIGCSKGAFSMWLSGQRSPNYKYRSQIANVLGVSIEWLDTGEDKPDPSKLPYISLEETNAFLDELEEKSRIAHRDSGIRLVESDGDSFLVTMNNDSMIEPMNAERTHVPVGSTIQIDRDRKPQSGNIILIHHNNELKLRIWQQLGKDLHRLKVINPHYQDTLNIEYHGDLKEIFKGTAVACRTSLV